MERIFEYATLDGKVLLWRSALMLAMLALFVLPFLPELGELCTYLKEAAK
jgi:hypothetical protein